MKTKTKPEGFFQKLFGWPTVSNVSNYFGILRLIVEADRDAKKVRELLKK
jgi:hypothetical protein